MKKIFYFVVALMLGLNACDNAGDTESKNLNPSDSSEANDMTPTESTTSYSETFQNLFKSDAGHFRGVSLGMSMAEVKKLEEQTKLEEETKDQLDYMLEYAELEEAEIDYMFNEYGRVNTIDVHVYNKNAVSQDSVFTQFANRFDRKYGKPVSSDSVMKKWEYKPDNLQILLEKKGNKKIHDINVRFTSSAAHS